MALNHSIVRRLAFVKYLYTTSISQSHAPLPLCCASLLTMHDAAEFFLQLASEHLNTGASRPDFMDYWDILSAKLGRDLEQKESMRRLNKARVALKHHGNFPSQLDIESFRVTTQSFFKDNTPLVFGVSLDDISLIEFVNPEPARQKLKEAEIDIAKSCTKDAVAMIAIAFEEMIADYESRKCGLYQSSPFYFGESMTFLSSFFMGLPGGPGSSLEAKLGNFVDRVKESIEAMQQAIKMLALGFDYRKYSRFKQLTPTVMKFDPDEYTILKGRNTETPPTPEEARFCLDFAIESAICLSEFDYTVDKKDNSANNRF